MSAGTIRAHIQLDEPDRIHYGNERPVTGNVLLRYGPSYQVPGQQGSEFFGPLKISVTLHGRLKTKVQKSNGKHSSTYRGRVSLFTRTVKIYDDSAKISSGEKWPVPFSVFLPERMESRIMDSCWEGDSMFDIRQEQPLPPSFVSSYHGFSNHYDSFIEYRVGVSVSAPHLPVNIYTTAKDDEPTVQYQQPRVPIPSKRQIYRFTNTVRISNEHLLPESDRPSGFREKTKAAFTSDFYPHYNFDWTIVMPQILYIGQPISFEINVKPHDHSCTAVVIPDINLAHFTVWLKGSTTVRAEKQILTCPHADHEEQLASFKGTQDDRGPFSKAKEWKKTINTPPVPERLQNSFQTVNISHNHFMQVILIMHAAEKVIRFDRNLQVTLLPPMLDRTSDAGPSSPDASAGPASQPLDMAPVEEALPRYEEGLPGYQEATASRPEPPPKDANVTSTSDDPRPV